MRRRGYLTDVDSSLPSEQAVFWDIAGVDADVAARLLKETAVSVRLFGQIALAPFRDLLTSLGIRIDDDADRWIVLTDDYLRDELRAFNQKALEHNRPWVLIKPVGSELWPGPLFIPGKTGCWTCLVHRLQGARKVENYLQAVRKTNDSFSVPPAGLPSTAGANGSRNRSTVSGTSTWIVRVVPAWLEGGQSKRARPNYDSPFAVRSDMSDQRRV